MSFAESLNDKTLSFAGFLLIALWASLKYPLRSPARADWDIPAATLLRIACGLLLTGASLDKVGDPAGFLKIIKECYDVLPASLVPLAAVVIPWLEFFTGLCLLTGFQWRGAALVFCALMLVYTPTVTWDLLHGIDCNCGCFKMDSAEKMSWWTVLRDVGFLGMGCIVLFSPSTRLALDRLNAQKDAP